MRSTTSMPTARIRAAKISYIIISLILCLSGIILLLFPDFSVSLIGILAGIFLILFGVVKLAGYFSKDLYRLAFQYDLAFGILLIILGVIILSKPDNLMNFLCMVLGISIMADGLFKIQISVDSRNFGLKSWWGILVLAIVTGAIGILLFLHPSGSARVLVRLLGVSLIADGILNLTVTVMTVRIIRNQKPDIIDAEYYKEN